MLQGKPGQGLCAVRALVPRSSTTALLCMLQYLNGLCLPWVCMRVSNRQPEEVNSGGCCHRLCRTASSTAAMLPIRQSFQSVRDW